MQNTLLYFGIVIIAIILTLILNITLLKSKNKLILVIIAYFIYLLLFVFHEYLYYFQNISLKSEKEALNDGYDWFNFTTHQSNFTEGNNDLTEGLYNGDYNMSANDAMINKYETYFKYLNLAPGKTLLDLGCGYCHWLLFCKKKGVIVKGVNLTVSQIEYCKKHYNIDIVYDDYRNYILTTNEKFDAISAYGPLEHLASCTMTPTQKDNIFNAFFQNINRCLKPNGIFLNSIMLMNPHYPNLIINKDKTTKNKLNLIDKIHCYNLASFYGCGRYPITTEYIEYAKNCFDIKLIQNITEDYRWSGIQNGEKHWNYGNIYINTPYRLLKLISYFFTDMWFWGRINYTLMHSWQWQFGGQQKTPIYNNNKSPMICNLYILQKKNKCNKKYNDSILKVN